MIMIEVGDEVEVNIVETPSQQQGIWVSGRVIMAHDGTWTVMLRSTEGVSVNVPYRLLGDRIRPEGMS